MQQNRRCEACGADILLTGRRGRPSKFCSNECRPVGRADEGVCAHCGDSFSVTGKRGPAGLFCSTSCKGVYHRDKHRVEQYCICGKVLPKGRWKYCSKLCARWGESNRAADRLRKKNGDPFPFECAFCGEVFVIDPVKKVQLRRKYCRPTCASQASRDGRRARIRGLPSERIDRYRVFERDEYVCGLCGEPVDRRLSYPDPMSASLDHVVPIARGGSHTYGNVQCSHLECNVRASVKGKVSAPAGETGAN